MNSLVDQAIFFLQSEGYLLCQLEYTYDQESTSVSCAAGREFTWNQIARGNLPDSLLEDLDDFPLQDAPLSFQDQRYWKESIAGYYANRGYPFAQVSVQHVILVSDTLVDGQWQVDPGQMIRYGEIIPEESKVSLRANRLPYILGLPEGGVYKETDVQAISSRLSRYPYLALTGSPKVRFANRKMSLSLPITTGKANSFDAMVGIFPQGPGVRPQLVGNANLTLWNPLGFGHYYKLNWESPQPNTQQLNVQAQWYHPLRLPHKVGLNFQLWRQDTAYLLQSLRLESAPLFQESLLKIGGYASIKNVVPLSDSTYWIPGGIPQAFQLLGGIQLSWGQTNETPSDWSARKLAEIKGSLGYREQESGSRRFYWEGNLETEIFQPMGALWGIYSTIRVGLLPSQNISGAEAYRIGGFALLRGFNERQFFTPRYGVATLEARLRTGEDSFLSAFWDQGFLATLSVPANTHYVWGAGVGLNWKLAPGILRFAWAVGEYRALEPFSWTNSKIHVGFVSEF